MHLQRATAPVSHTIGLAGFPAVLIERGLIGQNDLTAAEPYLIRDHVELADALVTLGRVSETDSYAALAAAAGTEVIALDDVVPSELAVKLVPEKLARRYFIVPLQVDNRTLTYATCCPFDAEAERDLGFATGRRTRLVVAARSAVLRAIDRCYHKPDKSHVTVGRCPAGPAFVKKAEPASEKVASTVDEICLQIVGDAVELSATDMQIECGAGGAAVRYRVGGVLQPPVALPVAAWPTVRDRFKTMARVGVAVRNRPQHGSFRVTLNSRPIDVRLSTVPTSDGEKIVLGLTASLSPLQELESLGYDEDTLSRLRSALARPSGLVLVTGPTGSGTTTALYAAVAHLRSCRSDVVSVEDPIERTVPGVTQVSVNAKAADTFPVILRAMLLQGPKAILVDRIRDGEVAQIVGQAAQSRHLVVSSIRTEDAATAIARLVSLGLEPQRVAACLSAVLAQRLLRTLCPHCRRTHDDIDARRRGAEHRVKRVAASAGTGCSHCHYTGYLGLTPVAELVTPSEDLREAILGGAKAHDIHAAMRAAGWSTMRERALDLVANGVTSIEEVNRVLPVDADEVPTRADARLRVLVADDEPVTRTLLKILLRRERFDVSEAANGRQAIEVASREHPDLLLIDLNMPEMDGFEAIGRLRRDPTMATLPIVVITAEDGPGVERRVLELGADDYIVKPFDSAILVPRVNAVFRRQRIVAA